MKLFGFFCLLVAQLAVTSLANAQIAFEQEVLPLLKDHCLTCHSTEKQEGELDLERFNNMALVTQHAEVFEHVLEQLTLGEMPPKDAPQLTADEKKLLMAWIRQTLDDVALAGAGDPGPVVLRRLSNQEYTYTLRDLTNIASLDPAREFPVDGAAGEGFTNVGSALVMSPALLSKYVDAAKEVARHAVMLPDGIRFSASTSSQDWTDEALADIRAFYARFTRSAQGSEVTQQGIGLDTGTGEGRLPVDEYLQAIQGKRSGDGLSPKYLAILQAAFESSEPSILLDPMREKFRSKQLTAADVEPWQQALWRFALVGHIGREGGPKVWQETVTPLVPQQEFRVPLEGNNDHRLYLIAGAAGDGNTGDAVIWENPRIVGKDRPELAISSLPELREHLESQRAKIIASTEVCLAALSAEQSRLADSSSAETLTTDTTARVDPELMAIWRDYFGFGSTALEPLLPTKIERIPDYAFIQGWTAGEDLSVLANSSDNSVRIPGIMPPHSVATHPSPSRAAVIAWQSPVSASLTVGGRVVDGHPECGNGVTWALEVRRGHASEQLAAGVSEGNKEILFGPLENVRVEPGQVVALVIGPRDANHVCDMTTIDLTLSDGNTTWSLAEDVSPNILKGNPHGPWHFVSQPVSHDPTADLPAPMVEWRKLPSAENAANVRMHLEKDFPLTHPLLTSTLRSFRPPTPSSPLTSVAPSILEVDIPAEFSQGAEFVVTGRLAEPGEGSVQLRVSAQVPEAPPTLAIPSLPIIVGDGSPARARFEQSFADFRELFPITVCYPRIVPVDEVVTLQLYYREDDHLRRLLLDENQARELDRLWDELLFVSSAPLKQVDALEQLYQFATQDRADLLNSFAALREPILKAAATFQERQTLAEAAQQQAVIDLAARAWRRPLTEREIDSLKAFPPRLMLVRVLSSPAFLYRGEKVPEITGPVNDWELATRLSYFLWSSLPDDELWSLAAAGKLRDPDVLAGQARRMLKHDNIRRLATEFGCQYLHVRDVATLNEKSERHFPTFVGIRDEMQEEVTRFFVDLFQNDRSALALLDADYSFMNDSLADHYGIPLEGTDWQRVEGLRDRGRGGVLGFAAILAKHSGASRSSAILRGTWLSEVILGDAIPNPPKGVPTLPEEAPEGLSERQLIERHSSDPGCAACHKRIDPYGFALEGFDAIGRARQAETGTVLFDGTVVSGLDDLRDYLLNQRRDDFVRQFSRKLLGYALGRGVQLSDKPLINSMVDSEDVRVGDLVELIVRSPQFREIRGTDFVSKH